MKTTSKLSMQKDSHLILKHKVRVIHLYEPKIIQTDVSNFREMVQKLTGKSAEITKRKTTSFVKPREGKVMKKDGALFDGFNEMDDDLFVEELAGFSIYPNSGIQDSKYMQISVASKH
ncbi:VQ domain-containing protein [Heracleum sosnowskyi]|uniref:VQ domain-containing protein n=1 Tax=Heracleum sosnowskyi TaxID=360622 RepID=A0AAD8HV98_9APIA|nr:VQ domain-containing protein [Heracleum sosnowskyi]